VSTAVRTAFHSERREAETEGVCPLDASRTALRASAVPAGAVHWQLLTDTANIVPAQTMCSCSDTSEDSAHFTGNAVGTVTGRLQARGLILSCGMISHFSISSRPALGPAQSIKWVPGIKRQGREADP
jgi:hypothetical protein